MRYLILLACCLWPAIAVAGPWPRAEGETFLSFSIESEFENGVTDGSDLFGSVYAEYGLTPRLTLGLDAGGHEEDFGKVIGFLRWPVEYTLGSGLLAAEFGLGYFEDTFAIRPGLSWGKGFTTGLMGGWVSVDSRVAIFDGFENVLETDITLGLKPAERSMVILQLQTTAPSESSAFAKLAPSYVYEWKPGHHLELGMTAGIMEADDFKLKLGVWRRF